jgi:drug/metabolite transporter (DMT)-like permease
MALFFGSNLVVSRYSLGQYDPVSFVSLRLALAALVAMLLSIGRYRRIPRGSTLWLHGGIVGVFSTAIPMTVFVAALQYQSAGVTALCISLTPISTMLFAHVRLPDSPITTRKVIGALVSLGGVAVLIATGQTGLGEFRWEGFALIAVGVVSNGFGIVHIRKYLSSELSLEVSAVRLVVGAAAVFPVAMIMGGYDLSRVEWSGVVALLYGVVVGTVVAFILYTFVAARFGPVKAAQQEYLVPVVAVIVGALFLGEQVSPVMVLGMICVVTGIAIATTPAVRIR